MDYVIEPEKKIKVAHKADLFVAGGSCTGVFAAVRAARLGLSVVLVERQNCLGGTATAGLVNIWHSFLDGDFKETIIAGLTSEVTDRMVAEKQATLIENNVSGGVNFNPFALQYQLDKLVKEEKIKVLFHTLCVGAVTENKRIKAAIIENKDGRTAVEASFYIDATGDGDLAKYLGMKSYRHESIQPPTPCFLMRGKYDSNEMNRLIREYGKEYGIPDDFGWSTGVTGLSDTEMVAYFHVFGQNLATGEGLSVAETEGRRLAFSLVKMLNDHTSTEYSVAGLSSLAGIRETCHFETFYQANKYDLLSGKKYDDTVMQGSYRIDTHDEDGTIVHMYMNGRAMSMKGAQRETKCWDWHDTIKTEGKTATYYSVPFEILVQDQFENIIPVGRMINADRDSFGALRVMVNLNQLGEAAGVGAYVCLNENKTISQAEGRKVKELLIQGGSAIKS